MDGGLDEREYLVAENSALSEAQRKTAADLQSAREETHQVELRLEAAQSGRVELEQRLAEEVRRGQEARAPKSGLAVIHDGLSRWLRRLFKAG